jgi:hypothetical protein
MFLHCYPNSIANNDNIVLFQGIESFWSTLTPEICNKYIDRVLKDARIIIERNGYPAGH